MSENAVDPTSLVGAIYSYADMKDVALGVDRQEVYADLLEAYGKATREFMEEKAYTSNSPVSCHSATKCLKQNWCKWNRVPGAPMHPRAKLNFRTGGIVELELYAYAKLGGADVDMFQHRYDWHIGPRGTEGNPVFQTSAFIDFRYTKPSGKRVIVDVKTMSDIGYQMFCRGGVDDAFGYLGQGNQYLATALEAGDIDEPAELLFLGYKKSTGHIETRSITFDQAYVEEARSNAGVVDRHTSYEMCPVCRGQAPSNVWCASPSYQPLIIDYNDDRYKCRNCMGNGALTDLSRSELPPRPEEYVPKKTKDDRWELPLQCRYCDFNYFCWSYPRMDDIKYEWSDEGEMVVRYPLADGDILQKVEVEVVKGKPKFFVKKKKVQRELEY